MGTLQDFTPVMDLDFTGKLTVAMDKTFPLAEAAAAQSRLENGEQLGKITLLIGDS